MTIKRTITIAMTMKRTIMITMTITTTVTVFFPDNCGDFCLKYEENYLSWDNFGIGKHLLFMFVQMVIFWLLVACVENDLISRLIYKMKRKIVIAQSLHRFVNS